MVLVKVTCDIGSLLVSFVLPLIKRLLLDLNDLNVYPMLTC